MNYLSDNLLSKILEERSQNSAKVLGHSLERIYSGLYGNDFDKVNVKKLLKDHKKVIKFIMNKSIPINSKKCMFWAICVAINLLNLEGPGKQELFEMRDTINHYSENVRAYEKRDPVLGDLKEIFKLIKTKRKEYRELLTDSYHRHNDGAYVLLSFFYYLPPLRTQDYVNTILLEKIKEDKLKTTTKNFISLHHKVMVINGYKTAKIYGRREIELPDKLVKILRNFKEKSKSLWLVPRLQGTMQEPMTSESCTHFINRIFGKKISTTELRRAYVSQKVINQDMKGSERKKVARIMAHSVSTQNQTYSKYSKLAD